LKTGPEVSDEDLGTFIESQGLFVKLDNVVEGGNVFDKEINKPYS
jgi:hypothetical protein